MKEIIESIKESGFNNPKEKYSSFSGFIVKTNKQEIKLGISDYQSCCENWGYFMSNDNIEDFIGAELIDVEIVDNCLVKEKLQDYRDANTMFVNINTRIGTLQFTAYNEHNGYYAHDAVVFSEKLSHNQYL